MGALPPQIPFGTDRADGGEFGGTATPDGARLVQPDALIFEEMPDSPIFDLGEQATCVKKFKVDPDQTLILLENYGRGQIFTDTGGRQWRILNIAVNYQMGDFNIVQVTSEGINIYIPQPEFDVEEVQINPAAQKHPRYAPLNQTFGSIVANNFVPGTFSPIAEVQLAVMQLSSGQGSSSSQALTDLQTLVNFCTAAFPNGDLIAQQAALELLKKLRRGEETFYLAGYKVSYSTYFPLMTEAGDNAPDLDMGGRIEDPTDNTSLVVIPPEFTTDSGGNSIFTFLAAELSPQFYQNGVSWFRQADAVEYQRTWMRRTSTWLMAPAGGNIQLNSNDASQSTAYFWIGQWDLQWYTPARPNTAEYPKYDF